MGSVRAAVGTHTRSRNTARGGGRARAGAAATPSRGRRLERKDVSALLDSPFAWLIVCYTHTHDPFTRHAPPAALPRPPRGGDRRVPLAAHRGKVLQRRAADEERGEVAQQDEYDHLQDVVLLWPHRMRMRGRRRPQPQQASPAWCARSVLNPHTQHATTPTDTLTTAFAFAGYRVRRLVCPPHLPSPLGAHHPLAHVLVVPVRAVRSRAVAQAGLHSWAADALNTYGSKGATGASASGSVWFHSQPTTPPNTPLPWLAQQHCGRPDCTPSPSSSSSSLFCVTRMTRCGAAAARMYAVGRCADRAQSKKKKEDEDEHSTSSG